MEVALDDLPYFDVHPSVIDRDAPKFPKRNETGQFRVKMLLLGQNQ